VDLKLNREEIISSEVIFSETQEQAVELDYVLPDYYPEIFKIIKCIAKPQIISYSISGSKLTYEMSVCIKVLYCSDSSKCTQVIDQKLSYTKTAELGKTPENPKVTIEAKTDYINCRAVNQRRIDVRGAVSIKIKVCDLVKQTAVCDAFGGNIELKKTPITYPVNRLYTTKRVSVSDNCELGAKPPIINILRADAVTSEPDKKVIANKLVAKGDANVNMLYTCQKDGVDSVDNVQFSMPYSQIIDLDGIDDRYDVNVDADVLSADVSPTTDAEGNANSAEVTLALLLTVTAFRVATVDVVTDEYSTAFETVDQKNDIKVELLPQTINAGAVIKSVLEYTENELENVYDVWTTLSNVNYKIDFDNSRISVIGDLVFTALAKNAEGITAVIEKAEPFEAYVPVENLTEYATADIKVTPVSCSYNLASGNTIDAKAEIRITGTVNNAEIVPVVTDISVDEEKPRDKGGDYALKLYFTDPGEDLWEIAKRYGTSVDAIIDENELDADGAPSGMLLIPIL
jgi:LysM repeat protein